MFSCADLSLATGKLRKNLLITGGFRHELQNFRVKIAVEVSLKRVVGRIFNTSKYAQEQGDILSFIFSSSKKQNCKNYQYIY
jgi:hypothetical protein